MNKLRSGIIHKISYEITFLNLIPQPVVVDYNKCHHIRKMLTYLHLLSFHIDTSII